MKHMHLVRCCSKALSFLLCLFAAFSAIMAPGISTAETEGKSMEGELLLSIDGMLNRKTDISELIKTE